MKLIQVPPEHFDKIPGRCMDDIEKAMQHAHGERGLGHVVAALVSGESQLWVQYSDAGEHIGTVVTRIIDYECTRVCMIEYCGGLSAGSARYFEHIQEIEDWARYNRCQEVRSIGRRGWERALKPYGYEYQYTVVGKPL